MDKKSASIPYFEIPIYEIKVGETGFMYVSADERSSDVLAYIPVMYKEIEYQGQDEGHKSMLELAELTALMKVKFVEHIKDSLRHITLQRLEEELDIENATFEKVKDYISVKSENITKNTISGYMQIANYNPKLAVSWNQNYPYSSELPFTTWNYPVGCGATAAAQILSFGKPSNLVCPNMVGTKNITINWSYLTETATITESSPQQKIEMIGALCRHAYYGVKSWTEFNLTDGSPISSPSHVSDAQIYLSSYMNISKLYSMDGYFPTMISALQNSNSILYAYGVKKEGSAHAWVIDGLKVYKKIPKTMGFPDDRYEYTYMTHCNYGWGGLSNGWYQLSVSTIFNTVTWHAFFNTQLGNYNNSRGFFIATKR